MTLKDLKTHRQRAELCHEARIPGEMLREILDLAIKQKSKPRKTPK